MAAARLAGGGSHVGAIEQSDRVGRKILATGNGRCNVLNMRLGLRSAISAAILIRQWPCLVPIPPTG